MDSTTFIEGIIVQHAREARLEETTFRVVPPSAPVDDRRLPLAGGVIIFLIVLLALLLT